ncbi:DUF4962 domain-containing protein [Verrucomicrobium spinosum]|uniref:DUF4962 domain-containing protein n=1 Tax=Verrucomicrobium spinosum TaxID=2736 RepID=UPI0018DE0A0E|nr:DUF4962 domain-containing protein [Verrucomicrobium spinosum]
MALLLLSSTTFAQVASPVHGVEKLPAGVTRVTPSELRVDRDFITPGWLDKPAPQGEVDNNPPWLHVVVPILTGNEQAKSEKRARISSQKWNRRFYFKLSQDPQLQKSVMESGPKRWSFFNPYRKLAPGTWYWTYGVADAEAPDKPRWIGTTYSFRIRGDEFSGKIPPTPEVLLAAVKARKTGPLVTCSLDEVGNMLPTSEAPALAAQIKEDLEKSMGKGADGKIDDPLVEARMNVRLLRGYLMTGDTKYKDLAIKREIELERLHSARRNSKPKPTEPQGPAPGKPAAGEHQFLLVDAFYDDLPKNLQEKYLQAVYMPMCADEGVSPELHEYLEHALYDNHAWQGRFPGLLMGSIILCRHKPEMDDWVKYAYELFLYRCPAFSRTDGGSSEGNGYFGVHEEQMVHVPWVLYKLTGFNFYNEKPWFRNLGRFMTYSSPPGNPGISFEDAGDDGGTSVPYLTEIMSRMCPENDFNLWRNKTVGRRSPLHFAADLGKGAKAWDMFSVWKKFPAPDLSKVKLPVEKSAAFKDVGLVCMHTDLENASNNMMLNFRAGPYGSEGHTHPAQNAFTLAYGGEPLFWRTGYYNGGPEHNILSYKCSRAHNTIMADGLVQGFHQSAYAWIARFADGERISYTVGDASDAYNAKHHLFSIPYDPNKTGNKVELRRNYRIGTRENGFGDPGVTRFRRHMVMLRPHHVLIYDELEAKKPITWTFQLGARQEMKMLSDSSFATANGHGLGTAKLYCMASMKGSLTDKFMGEARDDENKRKGQNPPNWHGKMTTQEALPATRFLTVLSVAPGKSLEMKVPEPVATAGADGRTRIKVGDYLVSVELDPTKPSYLSANDIGGTCALVTGQAAQEILLGGNRRPAAKPGSTLLWETKTAKGEVFQEKTDELPDSLKFGNRYF